MSDGRHEAGAEPIEVNGAVEHAQITPIDAAGNPIVAPTLWNQIRYYGKAFIGALVSGLLYLLTVLTPAATLGDITLMQWIGFWVTILGTFTGVAVTTNGAKPVKK